ncbi:GH39 family glycosyl hydrolase [Ferrimicrobium acidiphilum]|uniref:GH39 family glycosyl hydrolase n=1 Tax=Ferrimicrobium acidiphilum TaxID=121039 RepID=UPI0023F10B55|nr:hypothetical protein [Ferrimicrobium acidiphilum]
MADEIDARRDWELRVYERSDGVHVDSDQLPALEHLRAVAGSGCITLLWNPVPGAIGYLVECTGKDGSSTVLRHGESDVPAVPGDRFVVTGLDDGVEYRFRVAAVRAPEARDGAWSDPVQIATSIADPDPVDLHVKAGQVVGRLQRLWSMVGSERLSQLTMGSDEHGNDIGGEFHEALRIAHDDLGVRWVRAHAIFHDDLGVAERAEDGQLVFDFSGIDVIYDSLLAIGVRPVVELSFMPRALALDPSKTVFTYRGIISPPRDWREWGQLISEFVQHLVSRYGINEVATWPFEVWNEPNLEVFWTGSKEDYLRLYEVAARAIKAVDTRLQVGGPSSAASEWVELLARFTQEVDCPLDFVTTHTYGNLPLDFRPILAQYGHEGVPIYWTEWGVGSTHFGPVHDSVSGAPFVLSGYQSASKRIDALSYWVISDHFEELGRPPRLFHDGFGLLSVGNLRKPRYWAVHLAEHQGEETLELDGTPYDSSVEAMASRHQDGMIDVVIWNGSINTEIMHGDPRLDRAVRVTFAELAAAMYDVSIARVDQEHSNIVAHLPQSTQWPDEIQWEELRRLDRLFVEERESLAPTEGRAEITLVLSHPGVVRLRLAPTVDRERFVPVS